MCGSRASYGYGRSGSLNGPAGALVLELACPCARAVRNPPETQIVAVASVADLIACLRVIIIIPFVFAEFEPSLALHGLGCNGQMERHGKHSMVSLPSSTNITSYGAPSFSIEWRTRVRKFLGTTPALSTPTDVDLCTGLLK